MRTALTVLALTQLMGSTSYADDASGRVVVQISSIHSDAGQVGCLLYGSAEGFPTDPSKGIQRARSDIHDGKAVCEFTGLTPGTYAVSAIHDENNNGKLDTNFLGIPKEGVAVSNDAKGFMGPPKFEKAKFTFPGGVLNLAVHMKYL